MRRRNLTSASFLALALLAAPVMLSAADPEPAVPLAAVQDNEADPQLAKARVSQAIAGLPANEILSISGVQKIDDQVIYVDTLRFDDGATMQLLAGDRDAIYIVAREVRLSGPNFRARIEFRDRAVPAAEDGAPPPERLAQLPRSGGDGAPGSDGQPGNPGKPGLTRKLPTIYFVVGKVRQSTGGEPDFSDWRILAGGLDGGVGGNGGKGQDGQSGQDGRHGKANMGICSRGPRSGGNGGAGGAFGPGGIGGNGGNGGTVIFLVPEATVEAIKDVRVRNLGGLPGLGGLNGAPGEGGGGGSRGSRPGTCGGASHGSGGPRGSEPSSLRAPNGAQEGLRGRVYYHVIDFFA